MSDICDGMVVLNLSEQ